MPAPYEIRVARSEELGAVGELTARVYVDDGFAAGDYVGTLRDAAARAAAATLLVAVRREQLVGTVTVATAGGAYAEQAGPAEAVVRMLAVDPGVRGDGVGRALMDAALAASRAAGCTLVKLSSQPTMAAAHRLYGRLGFVRTPGHDWSPEPGVDLLTFALRL